LITLHWDWTGLGGKKLWDWLQLLIIPAVLAIGGYLFSLAHSSTEQEIALNNQREATLQDYLDKMSELLLEKHLRESPIDDEVRKIARVRTLTVLRRIDGERKASVLRFLYESDLINKDKPIMYLEDAGLSEAELIVATLRGAILRDTTLLDANLSGADLSGATIAPEQLDKAKSLKGAAMPDGSIHP
jgi:Pentapeptide repeats (8 copies)